MYTPQHNREDNPEKLLAFMRAYSFATLVTAHGGMPKATHLPFVVDADTEQLRLIAHMAKANDQWRNFATGEQVLVIFQEPHAYISPRYYERPLSVPTWNYVAVHAYGDVRICDDFVDKVEIVKQLIRQTDSEYLKQFDAMPAEFVKAKLKGIVAFKIEVAELQGRFKLSQDRTRVEQQTIVDALSADGDNTRARIGQLMAQELNLPGQER